MGKVVKSIFGGGDNAAAERSARGQALAGLLAREAEANQQMGQDGGSRRRRGNQILTFLNDEGGASSLN